MAGHQESTRSWWEEERHNFDLFISEAVIEEASAGDVDAARRRLEILQDIPELQIRHEVRDLAKLLVEQVPLPEKARIDALHVAVATVNGMDYLLTWNCRHIANATLRNVMAGICMAAGYLIPVICTPLELIEGYNNEG